MKQKYLLGTVGILAILLTLNLFVIEKQKVSAGNVCEINQTQLTNLYQAIFHRTLDSGAYGYVGHDLDFVLNEFMNSEEHEQYTKVFSKVKNLETTIRQQGNLSSNQIETEYTAISNAVAEISSWANPATNVASQALYQKGGVSPIRNFSGTGQKATSLFSLNSGLAVFQMTHTGQSNFIVYLLDGAGDLVDVLVNEIGSFDGSKAAQAPTTGNYILDISADGNWEITIEQ